MYNRQAENPLIDAIKTTFYNDLVDLTLNFEGIDEHSIDQRILDQIQNTVRNIIQHSVRNNDAISLPTGQTITQLNCPHLYLPFFNTLTALLNIHKELMIRPNDNDHFLFDHYLESLAERIADMDQFKQMLPQIKQFILEAKGVTQEQRRPMLAADRTPITPDLIRETFYNEMVNQTFLAVEEGWITKDELEMQEAFVFLALPALTLIESINQSANCAGIRLLRDKVMVPENCPRQEGFAELFIPILSKKADLMAVTADELKVIKLLCLAKEIEIPYARTPHAVQCAAIINEIASQISRRNVFKNTVMKVIEFCLESLGAQPAPGR